MDIRVARTLAAATCLSAVVTASTCAAQPAGEAPPAPALSRTCEVPAADLGRPEPLPRVSAALQQRRPIRVLAIGSSSTVGVGASSPDHNYPAQFESILEHAFQGLDVVVVNRGVSGETAAATAERLKVQVALEKPALVLWQVGTNDALARVPVEDFEASVRDALRWLKAHDIDVVLVGLQYALSVAGDEYYTRIRAALRDLAESENVLLVRRYEAMRFIETARDTPLIASDGLHLNDAGYRCMAEHIARAVVVSAFVLKGPRPRRRAP
jgi:acyl-CoA thioesterase-1